MLPIRIRCGCRTSAKPRRESEAAADPYSSWVSPAVRPGSAASAYRRSATVRAVSVLETLLVFALIPLAVYGVVALLTLRQKFNRPRYRVGQPWKFEPVWWVANPAGLGENASVSGGQHTAESTGDADSSTARGGASGTW